MHVEESQLKAFLLDSGLLKPDELKKAEEKSVKSGKALRDVLIDGNFTKEDELRRLEAYILGIPFVDLTPETIDPEILRIIPEPIARKHNIVAYRKPESGLEVAMLD